METYTMDDLQAFLDAEGIQHFKAAEITLLRGWGKYTIPSQDLWQNIIPTLKFLEGMRLIFGAIVVYSGYRTLEYNTHCGGAKNSQHMHFRAIDSCPVNRLYLDRYKEEILKAWKQSSKHDKMGVGIYSIFVHVDFGFSYRKW